jgi:flagellar biosynthetic protein FlhB
MELVSAGALLLMFGTLKALLPTIGGQLANLSAGYFANAAHISEALTPGLVFPVVRSAVTGFATVMLPVLAVALAGGILMNVMQTGFLFSTKAMGFKIERLNPLEGFKRIFSVRTVYETLKTAMKVGLVCLVLYLEITANATAFSMMMTSGPQASVMKAMDIIFGAAFKVCGVLAAVAVMDYFYQWRKYEKDLRMTKYEVKMEYKQTEGDPQIKGRIRQKQRQMAAMRMMNSVPDADVIITNPTHYAVALKYEEKSAAAPRVVARGKDLIAQKIKEIARENKVEIVEDKPLAQALYAACEVGDLIPASLYQAVAEILAHIYRMKNKDRKYEKR